MIWSPVLGDDADRRSPEGRALIRALDGIGGWAIDSRRRHESPAGAPSSGAPGADSPVSQPTPGDRPMQTTPLNYTGAPLHFAGPAGEVEELNPCGLLRAERPEQRIAPGLIIGSVTVLAVTACPALGIHWMAFGRGAAEPPRGAAVIVPHWAGQLARAARPDLVIYSTTPGYQEGDIVASLEMVGVS